MNEATKEIFSETLEKSQPSQLIKSRVNIKEDSITIDGRRMERGDGRYTYIIAAGKASRPMTAALKQKLDIPGSNICCITPDTNPEEPYCISSSHPIPDQKSKSAANQLVEFTEAIPAGSTVFFALSGGASALICKPVEGVSLQHMNIMNEMLLKSGATIREINSVRKHLSLIKGGQLLTYFNPGCRLIDLMISDVPSDDPAIIGSGPTTPDASTFQDAYDTLLRYNLWKRCPEAVREYVEKGLTGEAPETLKPGHDPLQYHRSFIIGSARVFAETAAEIARNKGFKAWVADQPFNESVKKVAEDIAAEIERKQGESGEPEVLVFYGESTVEVTGEGKGGRNQELALRGARLIDGYEGVTWLSAGTDGIDGPTDAAGAVVDGNTIREAKEKDLDIEAFIRNNDSYHFHRQLGTLLKTGPTGNNVMDVVIVIVE